MRFLREVIGDIQKGENLDLYATVAVSVVLVVLNIFGVALPLAAPLSLGIRNRSGGSTPDVLSSGRSVSG